PLAPPSRLALSLDDMLLHFKIFVVADLYQKILIKEPAMPQGTFNLSDIELDELMNEAIKKSPLLNNVSSLKVFFLNQNLYIGLEKTFFRTYLLEVLPLLFEFKIEPINNELFIASLEQKNNVERKKN
ncbi:MAG: hypothetical protein ACD_79C01217G0001, partial [uncultured bacterium]